jgi:hypothetical protein
MAENHCVQTTRPETLTDPVIEPGIEPGIKPGIKPGMGPSQTDHLSRKFSLTIAASAVYYK